MKNLILNLMLLLIGTSIYAQPVRSGNGKKITEGTITYSVEWNLPNQFQSLTGNFPTELKVYFKGDSTSSKTESPMYKSASILNASKKYERLLLDIPLMGKKFSVIFSPADKEKMLASMPDFTLKAGTETKSIAGYKAVKHEVNEKKSHQNSEAWFTKELDITENSLTRFFDKSFGFPLEFTSYMNGLSIKAVVKEIKAGVVPAGAFSASEDYEEITLDQLMQMQRGG